MILLLSKAVFEEKREFKVILFKQTQILLNKEKISLVKEKKAV